jgi:Methyltransferase domain
MDATTLESHLNRQAQRSKSFFWNRLRWDLVTSQLPPRTAFELVDVGAGPGFLGDYLRQAQPEVDYRFVEPLEGLENGLEERFGAAANLRESDSFAGAGFVTLLDVLEHQEDDRAFLRELAEKMAPASRLLLTVPAMPSLWSEWDVVLGHHRRYTKESMRAAIAGLPFEAEEVSYIFPELLPLGWIRRLRRGSGDAVADDSAEFPDLPGWLNQGLYRFGTLTMARRRRWPAGTSLFASLRRAA